MKVIPNKQIIAVIFLILTAYANIFSQCNYEYSGTVVDYSFIAGCDLVIELDNGTKLEINTSPNSFTIQAGQNVELSYIDLGGFTNCNMGLLVDIICIQLAGSGGGTVNCTGSYIGPVSVSPSSPTTGSPITITVEDVEWGGCCIQPYLTATVDANNNIQVSINYTELIPPCTQDINYSDLTYTSQNPISVGTYDVYVEGNYELTFTVSGGGTVSCTGNYLGPASVSPSNPTESNPITITVEDVEWGGCCIQPYLTATVDGNNNIQVSINYTELTPPCTQDINYSDLTYTSQNPVSAGTYDVYVEGNYEFTFTVSSSSGGSSNEAISISPNSPDECDNVIITASGDFSNGCPFIATSNYTITGNTIDLNITTGAFPPPCTFAIVPWDENFNIGNLSDGFYTVRLYMDGNLAVTSNFSVDNCVNCNTIPSITQTIDKGHTYAQIKFQLNNDAESYRLRWRPQGSFNWTTMDLEEYASVEQWHHYPIAPPCYCQANCFVLPAFSFPDQVDIRGLDPCTTYEFQIASICANGSLSNYSSPYIVNTEACGNNYYTNNNFSVGMYPDYGRISHFQIGGVGYDFDEHGTGNTYCTDCNGCPNPYDGYNFFSNRTINLSPGNVIGAETCSGVDLNMDLWFDSNGSDLENWFIDIWIDYNRDGDFNDSGENVYTYDQIGLLGAGCLLGCEYFTIPNNIQTGMTRLRVSISQGVDADHDDIFDFGHVFDFPVNMQNTADVCENFFATNNSTNVTCSALGSVVVTGNNGQPPYSYNIGSGNQTFNSFNNLNAGNYVVTVTDANNCTANTTVTINSDINNIQIGNLSNTTLNCSEDFITLNPTVNGSTPPYAYTWSNGSTASSISVSIGGTYSLTVSDSDGCTEVSSVTIFSNSDFPSLTFFSSNPTCNNSNGNITTNVTNGSGQYAYDWYNSNGQTIGTTAVLNNLPEGLYTLGVTDINTGCDIEQTVQLTNEGDTPNSSFSITSNIDGQVSFNNTSSFATAYNWEMGDGTTLTDFEPTYTYNESGEYLVCLQAENTTCGTTIPVCESITVTLPSDNIPWTFVETEFTHNVILIEDLVSDINGQALSTGDYVGFFYEHNGQEFCAGLKRMEQGNATNIIVYGNDALAPNKNGFSIGEVFRVKVWLSATEEELSVTANYVPIGSLLQGLPDATNQFESEKISVIDELKSSFCMTIDLEEGVQMISSYVIPTGGMDEIIEPIRDDLVVIQNDDGEAVFPLFGINEIDSWDVREGYKVRMENSASFEICGQLAESSVVSIPVNEGVQWISYLKENANSTENELESIEPCLVWLKNQVGDIYIPSLNVNSIPLMEPTVGYKLKADCSGELFYGSNLDDTYTDNRLYSPTEYQSLEKNDELSFYAEIANTGIEAALVIPEYTLNSIVDKNDEIAAFTSDGILCGVKKHMGDNLFMVLYGDDTSTPEKEGLSIGEAIQLRFWDVSKNQETILEITLEDGDFIFSKDELFIVSDITLLRTSVSNINTLLDWDISPNPSNSYVTINVKSSSDSSIYLEILSYDGRCMQSANYLNETTLNLSTDNLVPGLYWCRLSTKEGSSVKKLVVQK